jgi:hypothetical protein
MMQSKERRDEKQKKGLLKRPINVWKLTLPLWLVVIAGCCIISVAIYGIDAGLRGIGALPTHTPTPAATDTPVPTDTAVPTDTPEATEEPTDTPEPTEPPGRVMYFCGIDRVESSGAYGELLFQTGINVWNNPEPDRGGVHHQASHHDKVTVMEEKRVSEGSGGLWYRLEGGGWTNDLWLTEEPCTQENLDQYTITD